MPIFLYSYKKHVYNVLVSCLLNSLNLIPFLLPFDLSQCVSLCQQLKKQGAFYHQVVLVFVMLFWFL